MVVETVSPEGGWALLDATTYRWIKAEGDSTLFRCTPEVHLDRPPFPPVEGQKLMQIVSAEDVLVGVTSPTPARHAGLFRRYLHQSVAAVAQTNTNQQP
jgi:hypothetical protein